MQRPTQIFGGHSKVAATILVRASWFRHPILALTTFQGIVTAFTLSTYPIHEVWGGIKSYTLRELPALFSAMIEYQSNPNKDPYANVMMQAFVTNASVGAILNMVYLKPEPSPAAFSPFYPIPTTSDNTKIQTLTQMLSGQLVPAIPRYVELTTPPKRQSIEIRPWQIRLVRHKLHTQRLPLPRNSLHREHGSRAPGNKIPHVRLPSPGRPAHFRERRPRGQCPRHQCPGPRGRQSDLARPRCGTLVPGRRRESPRCRAEDPFQDRRCHTREWELFTVSIHE